MLLKQYYDKFLVKGKEGICLFCNKPTRFLSFREGYARCCNIKCANKLPKPTYNHQRRSAAIKKHIANLTQEELTNRQANFIQWASGKRSPEFCQMRRRIQTGKKPSFEARAKRSRSVSKAIVEGRIFPLGRGWFGRSKSGFYFSQKNSATLYYASLYELAAFNILEKLSIVLMFKRCPFRIPYQLDDGSMHHYIPDIFVIYSNGAKEVIEVKPQNLVFEELNQKKFAVANEFCAKQGLVFSVWTEPQLKRKDLWEAK